MGDDHPLYRDALVRAVSLSGEIEVVGAYEDGRAALDGIREHEPDVAVIDFRMPVIDGVAVTHAVVRDKLATRVLIVSAFEDPEVIYRALEEGAAGYLTKESSQTQILDAALTVARGGHVIPPDIASYVAAQIRVRAQDDAPILTDREREVLRLVAAGKSVPEIARELFLGATTVKTHLSRLYEKLGVSDRAAAVAEAMRRGLIE